MSIQCEFYCSLLCQLPYSGGSNPVPLVATELIVLWFCDIGGEGHVLPWAFLLPVLGRNARTACWGFEGGCCAWTWQGGACPLVWAGGTCARLELRRMCWVSPRHAEVSVCQRRSGQPLLFEEKAKEYYRWLQSPVGFSNSQQNACFMPVIF